MEKTQEIKESEERYRRLFEAAKDGILILDYGTGMIVDVNPYLISLLGYSKEDFLEKHLWEVGIFREVAESKAGFLRLKAKGYIRYEDLPLKTKYGKNIEVEFVINVYGVGDRKVIQCNVRNITERKSTEKELVNLRLGFERSDQILFMTDRQGIFTYVNPSFEKAYGYSRGEVVGKVTPRILKSGLRKRKDYAKFWKSLLSRKAVDQDIVNRAKDGRLLAIAETVNPALDEKGEITGFLAIQRDITQRKKADEELQLKTALLEAENNTTPDGILVADNHGKILMSNKSFMEMWHVSKAKWGSRDENETLTLNMAQIRDPKKFLDKVKFLYSRPKERSRDELEFKDGRVFERYSAPLRDASGKYLGRVWYFHDISERKELEEFLTSFNNRLKEQVDERTRQLQEEKEKVEELARAKDNVIRDVSHELKTPLSVMIGNIALLKMPEIAKYPKKHADILDMLERNSVRLGESINQILNASRITTGNFKMQDFLLDDTIRDIVEEHAPLAKEKGLLLSAKCEGIELEGDQLLIGLAIKNLVSNAIKFTDNGKVSIKAWNSNDNVIIQVSDTGKGMSPEERKSLFVRFFKADRNAGGSGIGLVTSNEIIMKHKGKITVETKKGGGTAFTVILPRRQ